MRRAPLFTIIACSILFSAHPSRAATEIPFTYREGMIWVKVAAAGQSLNFLLDSGAGASVLDLAAARRLGLKLGARQTVQGVDGRGVAYRIDGFSARVAGVTVASSLLAMDMRGLGASCGRRIDGLLGADFFRDRIVQIDFAAETIRLLDRSEMKTAGGEVLPLTRRNDCLCVRAAVNGGAPEWLRVDTGCNSALEWVVTGDRAKQFGLTTIGLHAGSAREFHTDVQLGGTRLAAVKTGVHTAPMFAGEAGLIGNGLLARFIVTIDAAQRRCVLARR